MNAVQPAESTTTNTPQVSAASTGFSAQNPAGVAHRNLASAGASLGIQRSCRQSEVREIGRVGPS